MNATNSANTSRSGRALGHRLGLADGSDGYDDSLPIDQIAQAHMLDVRPISLVREQDNPANVGSEGSTLSLKIKMPSPEQSLSKLIFAPAKGLARRDNSA